MIEKIALHPEHVHGWGRFKRDIAAGVLPAFSWVNPRWFVNETSGEGASDQHPDHDVRLGEVALTWTCFSPMVHARDEQPFSVIAT